MKIKPYLPLAIASIAIATSHSALAQFPVASASQTTIELTVTIPTGPTYSGTESNGTVTFGTATRRISNKQILQMLVAQGVINNADGWSIAYVVTSPESDGQFYLTKTGKTPRNVSSYLRMGNGEDSIDDIDVQTGSYTVRNTESSRSESGTINYSGFGAFALYPSGREGSGILIHGNVQSSVYFSYFSSKSGSNFSLILNALNLLNGTGSTDYFGPTSLVQGSVTGTKGVPIQVIPL